MKKTVIAALIIAIGLLALGLSIKAGMDNFSDRDRTVSVRGLAERQVEANSVSWPMSYDIAGNDLPQLYAKLQSNNRIIVDFLTTNGIDSAEIFVNPPSVYNAEGNVYGGDRARYQYNFTSTITVNTSKVQLVRRLLNRMPELLRQGVAVNNNYTSYTYTDLNSIKPEMIAEATRNAREAADKFASDSHSKVGKISTASQGQFSIESVDSSTPYLMNVRVVSYITYFLED
ncbi:MAG: SIMPL domain-containing protein [Muribaculaceae bacterium]|nr:SIMPL domain-containing protein [Muribaculaceae bacterium]